MTTRIGNSLLIAAALLLAACGNIFSRADFTTMVMDKSEEEVTSKAGKPAEVDATNPGHVVWTYKLETFNNENGNKRDDKTKVIFEPRGPNGKLKVTNVEFG